MKLTELPAEACTTENLPPVVYTSEAVVPERAPMTDRVAATADQPKPRSPKRARPDPWPLGQMPETGQADWYRLMTAELRDMYGLSEEGATVLTLAFIGVLVGPVRQLKGVLGETVTSQLNVCFADEPGSRFCDAFDWVFAQLRQQVELAERMKFEEGEESLNAHLKELSREQGGIVAATEGPRQRLQSGKPRAEQRDRSKMAEKELQALQKQQQDLQRKIRETTVHLRPSVIVDDVERLRKLDLEQESFDATVTAIDCSGESLARFCSLRRPTRDRQHSQASAVWSQFRPMTGVKSPPSFRKQLSLLWTSRRSDIQATLRRPVARQCGLGRLLLFVPTAGKLPEGFAGFSSREGFEVDLQKFVKWASGWRRSQRAKVVSLEPQAGKILDQWLVERSESVKQLGSRAELLPCRLSSLVMKLTLLLHLATNEPGVDKVPAVTAKAATALADRLIRGHLDLVTPTVAESGQGQQSETSSEIEIIIAKLSTKGAMSARSLARSFHRGQVGEVRDILNRAMQLGAVTEEDGKYRVGDVWPSESRRDCRHQRRHPSESSTLPSTRVSA